MSHPYQSDDNVIMLILIVVAIGPYPELKNGGVKHIFVYDKCMTNYFVFRVSLKMYKTDLGHFFFSVTIF